MPSSFIVIIIFIYLFQTKRNNNEKRFCWNEIFLSPRRVSPFLAWGDLHSRSRFARSTIPEEKWGTTRSLCSRRLPKPFLIFSFSEDFSFEVNIRVCSRTFNWVHASTLMSRMECTRQMHTIFCLFVCFGFLMALLCNSCSNSTLRYVV